MAPILGILATTRCGWGRDDEIPYLSRGEKNNIVREEKEEEERYVKKKKKKLRNRRERKEAHPLRHDLWLFTWTFANFWTKKMNKYMQKLQHREHYFLSHNKDNRKYAIEIKKKTVYSLIFLGYNLLQCTQLIFTFFFNTNDRSRLRRYL